MAGLSLSELTTRRDNALAALDVALNQQSQGTGDQNVVRQTLRELRREISILQRDINAAEARAAGATSTMACVPQFNR